MTTPQRRRCTRAGCPAWMTPPGTVCALHRADSPPRPYHRWNGEPEKACVHCGEVFPVDTFRVAKGRPVSYCQRCQNAVNQEYRARHHDELLERRRATYADADPTRSYAARNRRHYGRRTPE